MENQKKKEGKFTQSITFKAIVIATLTLLMLIPGSMIESLISERQYRSMETIEKINEKWSNSQTICGPVLSIPYTTSFKDTDGKIFNYEHIYNVTPEKLTISAKLFPEERHYGIYKTILYRSKICIEGNFMNMNQLEIKNSIFHWDKAYLSLGISDLRGVANDVDIEFNGKFYKTKAGNNDQLDNIKSLIANINDSSVFQSDEPIPFSCNMDLNGSKKMDFIPIGKTTKVELSGNWISPGFIGNFSPDYTLNDTGFVATWNILHFNRDIPENWSDKSPNSFYDSSFGVNLISTVDHYQQNMRCAKYALMFIALTFVVFFFVELLTKKRIHPIQYLLVGIALILFYSLLLSLSEQINFGIAYLIASIVTIGLIAVYAYSIFKNKTQTVLLAMMLSGLYAFLYVVLQLEDYSLLIGSIGLFVILGIIMFVSRKINWYKQEEIENENKEPNKIE
jgi:inner membrane protein